MDKVDKFFVVFIYAFISALLLDKIISILRESNARLLTEALGTTSGLIVSIHGYNEFYIIGVPILFGFASALLAVKLAQKDEQK